MIFIITKSVKLKSLAADWSDFRLEKVQSRRLFLKMPYLFFQTSGLLWGK